MAGNARVTLVALPASYIASLQDLQTTTISGADLATHPPQAAQAIAGAGGDVAVLGPELDLRLALDTTAELVRSFPEIDVVLMADPTQGLLNDAMRVGVRQVVGPEVPPAELAALLKKLCQTAILRRSRLAADSPDPENQGRLITVMAAKGGVGKTTVALNLAAILSHARPDEVVLVDLNLMAGDIDMMVGLDPKSTIASVATSGTLIDTAVVKLSLSRHPSGLLILAAPESLVEADAIDCDLVTDVLRVLKSSFAFTVVDTSPGADAALASAVELADDLLAVTTPDLAALRSLRRNLDGLDTLGLNTARRHLVLNRADYRTGLTAQNIEHHVEMPITQSIPDARELPTAANQGLILVQAQPKSEVARAFRALAVQVNPTEAAKRRVSVAA